MQENKLVVGVGTKKLTSAKCDLIIRFLKKKNKNIAIEKQFLEKDELLTETENVLRRLGEQKYNIAFIDMDELYKCIGNGVEIPQNVSIATLIKRRDQRFVLIKRKRKNDILEGALICTISEDDGTQFCHLYDDVTCVVEKSINRCFKKLIADECDAILVPVDDVKIMKRDKIKGLSYNYLDCKTFIPAAGTASTAILTSDNDLVDFLRDNYGDEETEKCFDIENELTKRIGALEFVDYCRVNAEIERNVVRASVYAFNERKHFRYEEKEKINNINLLMHRLVEEVRRNL
ncbi:MAG: hypothetical protein Q4F06_08155 [Eubacteriales bacterium]|nr:hypothetical protein [Eubacteriales bacterium]